MDGENTSRNKGLKAPRARFHDYRSAGYYFITLTAHEDTVPLSEVRYPGDEYMRKGTMIIPDHTPLGNRVREELDRITHHCPLLRILRFVIMPDHIHFVLNVTDRLEKPVGTHLARFSKECSGAYTFLADLSTFTTIFKPFDDEIIFNFRQLDRAIKYTEDNPRRYLLRRMYPDLYQRYLHVVIGGHEYAAFGNIFMLRDPFYFRSGSIEDGAGKNSTAISPTAGKRSTMGLWSSPLLSTRWRKKYSRWPSIRAEV